MKRKIPPAIAAAATTPTTTPAAMPALLGPDFLLPTIAAAELDAAAALDACTVTVSPPTVTTDGVADVVDVGATDEEELAAPDASAFGALVAIPVRYTDQYLTPPQFS